MHYSKQVEMETLALVNYSPAAFFLFAHKELQYLVVYLMFISPSILRSLTRTPLLERSFSVRENVQSGS
jgi:hypothetical protein